MTVPKWQSEVASMLHSDILVNNQKGRIANLIWNHKYNHKSKLEKQNYITTYIQISKIIHITQLFRYINDNYQTIFSFNVKNIEFLKVFQGIKIKILSDIQIMLKTTKLSKSQKKRILVGQQIMNKQNPNMCNEIGNVLNRIFIKDIALIICEYI